MMRFLRFMRRFNIVHERWLADRSWLDLPVVLAILGCLVLGVTLYLWKPAAVRASYLTVLNRALEVKDFPKAEVVCRRLLTLGTDQREQLLYQLAIAMQGLGRRKEAKALIDKAAPVDKLGYPPAHLYLAEALLSGTQVSSSALRTAELHLHHVLDAQPENIQANEILGQIDFQKKEWASAIKHFLAITQTMPEAMFQLIATYQLSGDEKKEHEWIERARSYYQNKVDTERMDISQDRLCLAKALALSEEYAKAVEILETGFKRTENKIYRAGIADLCAVWARSLAKGNSQLPLRIKVLNKGLVYASANPDLLELLLQISHMEGPEAATARETVTKMFVEGGQSAILHLIAGNDAWVQGHIGEAHNHWSIAYDLASNMPIVANNLAMILSIGEKPDLPRALEIINSTIEKDPQNPNFHDTRGQILVKLGRWKEAVQDLEFALPRLSAKSTTHAALATAYRELGMQELADAHKRAGEEESAKEKTTSR